jgi:Mor family transcriptional regulator
MAEPHQPKGCFVSENQTKHMAPQFLADLIDYSNCVLVKHGIDKELAANIAKEISKQMCSEWGGQLIYFPYWLRIEISERDLKIYSEFNGINHAELSRKYKRSIQSIYRIVNAVRMEEIAKRQGTLGL